MFVPLLAASLTLPSILALVGLSPCEPLPPQFEFREYRSKKLDISLILLWVVELPTQIIDDHPDR